MLKGLREETERREDGLSVPGAVVKDTTEDGAQATRPREGSGGQVSHTACHILGNTGDNH